MGEVTEQISQCKQVVAYLKKSGSTLSLPHAVVQESDTRWDSKADMLARTPLRGHTGGSPQCSWRILDPLQTCLRGYGGRPLSNYQLSHAVAPQAAKAL